MTNPLEQFDSKPYALQNIAMFAARYDLDKTVIPGPDMLQDLRYGDIVQLLFALPDADIAAYKRSHRNTPGGRGIGEQLWVVIDTVGYVGGEQVYTGFIDTAPKVVRGVQGGSLVEFADRHIYRVWSDPSGHTM